MKLKYDFDKELSAVITVLQSACNNTLLEFENNELSRVTSTTIKPHENAPIIALHELIQKIEKEKIRHFVVGSRGHNAESLPVSTGLFKSKALNIFHCKINKAIIAFEDNTAYLISLTIAPVLNQAPSNLAEEEEFVGLGGKIEESCKCLLL